MPKPDASRHSRKLDQTWLPIKQSCRICTNRNSGISEWYSSCLSEQRRQGKQAWMNVPSGQLFMNMTTKASICFSISQTQGADCDGGALERFASQVSRWHIDVGDRSHGGSGGLTGAGWTHLANGWPAKCNCPEDGNPTCRRSSTEVAVATSVVSATLEDLPSTAASVFKSGQALRMSAL